ncbi:MAG: SDR family oxidoreductase [Chloroflexota bacterium]|nr:SDR family oxidoreductase [Chloroflexota bacterium]
MMDSRIILTTGAASGIGQETARRFLAAGDVVLGCDLNQDGLVSLAEFAKSAAGTFYGVGMDITRPEDYQIAKDILKDYGRLDVLVNAAGICSGTSLSEISSEEWDRTYSVNVKGPFFLTRSLIGFLTNGNSPTIINISSLAGFTGGIQSNPAYSSSKASLTCMTKNLAKYCAPLGIRVNEVAPGTTRTAMTENWLGESALDEFVQMVPMERLAAAEDIAKVILFLASEDAGFMTGQSVHVNGGMYIP